MAFENFHTRHIGPREQDIQQMLKEISYDSLDQLIEDTVPDNIRLKNDLALPKGISEYEYFRKIKSIAGKNMMYSTYIGTGYYNCILPAVIQRNILENPGWYTSYTPYQAEISQGRLEALLNYQTAITELTGLPLANASLLDEATAAAEAMIMLHNARSRKKVKDRINRFFVDENVFPQTMAILKTRAEILNIELETGDFYSASLDGNFFGSFVQYPGNDGNINNYKAFVNNCKEKDIKVIMACDILSLAILKSPGEIGADVAVGSTQRFGIPMGAGGPHAAYFACTEDFKRFLPGRIIGVSKDSTGKQALRMALQTREQHIKREKATSNICTAQALLATMAGMYAVYHGQDGLQRIAYHCHEQACKLSDGLKSLGYINKNTNYFDTLYIETDNKDQQSIIRKKAIEAQINFRYFDNGFIGISVDETTTDTDINNILQVFAFEKNVVVERKIISCIEPELKRTNKFMQQAVFNSYRSETDLMRYIKKLERRDIALNHSMISLGSCTMKLNAAIEMLPLSWAEFGSIHPFAPKEQTEGYEQLYSELGNFLLQITGFQDISFQPNSGASGELAGLLTIKKYQESIGESHRNVVIIPASAHGTNPASAVMAGCKVVVVKCDDNGNIDIRDLKEKATENADNLSAFMVTYPSTHGVYESQIKEMLEIVHINGGQVYMDGANMNAQVGLTSPAEIGADVCHLNLHKTFAIPHGGGGPGVGPICVAKHLSPYLPSHPAIASDTDKGVSAVSAAPYGSASILTISHAYCSLLGGEGLTQASKIAILNANYIAKKLKNYYNVLYTGENKLVAHEMILDCRIFKASSGITETDIAKRLIDYGFHAPTLSFPVHGTLMVEPTESEPKEELDRFIESMISIYDEIKELEKSPNTDNVLVNSPHTQDEVTADEWNHTYSRKDAAFPKAWLRENKFWPLVSRIDDAYGDRNLFCTCPNVVNPKPDEILDI